MLLLLLLLLCYVVVVVATIAHLPDYRPGLLGPHAVAGEFVEPRPIGVLGPLLLERPAPRMSMEQLRQLRICVDPQSLHHHPEDPLTPDADAESEIDTRRQPTDCADTLEPGLARHMQHNIPSCIMTPAQHLDFAPSHTQCTMLA